MLLEICRTKYAKVHALSSNFTTAAQNSPQQERQPQQKRFTGKPMNLIIVSLSLTHHLLLFVHRGQHLVDQHFQRRQIWKTSRAEHEVIDT